MAREETWHTLLGWRCFNSRRAVEDDQISNDQKRFLKHFLVLEQTLKEKTKNIVSGPATETKFIESYNFGQEIAQCINMGRSHTFMLRYLCYNNHNTESPNSERKPLHHERKWFLDSDDCVFVSVNHQFAWEKTLFLITFPSSLWFVSDWNSDLIWNQDDRKHSDEQDSGVWMWSMH